jgi:hypothetical protein
MSVALFDTFEVWEMTVAVWDSRRTCKSWPLLLR